MKSSGVLQGKADVRAYWKEIAQIPDLHFELKEVLMGVDSITLWFDGTGIKKAWACYAITTTRKGEL